MKSSELTIRVHIHTHVAFLGASMSLFTIGCFLLIFRAPAIPFLVPLSAAALGLGGIVIFARPDASIVFKHDSKLVELRKRSGASQSFPLSGVSISIQQTGSVKAYPTFSLVARLSDGSEFILLQGSLSRLEAAQSDLNTWLTTSPE